LGGGTQPDRNHVFNYYIKYPFFLPLFHCQKVAQKARQNDGLPAKIIFFASQTAKRRTVRLD
jgi:hypothetical protein